jgi:hypothetical protein
MLSGDLRKILDRIGCNYCTLVTFAMKATVLTARSILRPAFVNQLAYAEIDVGFEPFIIPPWTIDDEISHVPLGHRAEDWSRTFLAFCLPKPTHCLFLGNTCSNAVTYSVVLKQKSKCVNHQE